MIGTTCEYSREMLGSKQFTSAVATPTIRANRARAHVSYKLDRGVRGFSSSAIKLRLTTQYVAATPTSVSALLSRRPTNDRAPTR
jgi:hypothetical protein